MEFSSILFYVFGFCFVASSAMLVIARNTLKAAMLLILSFFSVASLWLLLEAEFLAITLILVYVGAVMVLFLFVIKMLNKILSGWKGMKKDKKQKRSSWRYLRRWHQ